MEIYQLIGSKFDLIAFNLVLFALAKKLLIKISFGCREWRANAKKEIFQLATKKRGVHTRNFYLNLNWIEPASSWLMDKYEYAVVCFIYSKMLVKYVHRKSLKCRRQAGWLAGRQIPWNVKYRYFNFVRECKLAGETKTTTSNKNRWNENIYFTIFFLSSLSRLHSFRRKWLCIPHWHSNSLSVAC